MLSLRPANRGLRAAREDQRDVSASRWFRLGVHDTGALREIKANTEENDITKRILTAEPDADRT